MNNEVLTRRLSAILSADVEGYSRLMREDEEATVRTITAHRATMTHMIEQYRGRVVDSPGDNLLAEFSSVVDAVNCGVEIQRELAERNEELPENRRMPFRIGINLGDVLEEGGRIYGDGVNIAARMESLAEAGGICISGTVYNAIENKIGLEYEDLGKHRVKNIDKPIQAYKVLSYPGAAAHRVVKVKRAFGKTRRNAIVALAGILVILLVLGIWKFYFRQPPIEPASLDKLAFPLPDKPSIAVLPFDNMSGDPKQDFFSDGLTDQIISGISRVPNIFVIARNSTFTFKDKPVKVQEVAEDLGVRYVLEGSVQKSEDKVRITAQLIDAITGHHVWSESYDRNLEDIFAIQDDITMQIMKAMQVKLTRGEQARLWGKHETTNLSAYIKSQEGRAHILKFTKEDMAQARKLIEDAIALDPKFAAAYVFLGWTHFFDARFGWAESPKKSIKKAFDCAQKALQMDNTLDYAYTLLSAVYLVKRQFDKAITEAKHALSLNPNGAHEHNTMAGVLGCSGKWEESILYGKKSLRLDPFPPPNSYHWLGRAYFMTGQYQDAISTFRKALRVNPNYLPAHAFLAASYSSLGLEKEATKSMDAVLSINPKFCLESYAKTLPYKNKSDIERYMDALRKAGLPETPQLPLPDKPSIAVLPFVNMSGDPEQEFFSDGISEEIITALSKTSKLFVIARTSSFKYKGKEIDIRAIGRELGVRYVLEGSVRKSDHKVRVTAQLIDAPANNHLWADRYDRDLEEIFAVQDEITKKIIAALQVRITEGDQARLYERGTNNLDAYLKILQAFDLGRHQNPDDNQKAKRILEEAIALDPRYAVAYRLLGALHMMDVWLGSTSSTQDSLRQAAGFSRKAISLDESLGSAHALLGHIYILMREYKKGIAEGRKAVELEPNGADSHAYLGMGLIFAGKPENGVQVLEKAIRLNPMAPGWYLHMLAAGYRDMERYPEAIKWAKKAVVQYPNNAPAHLVLAGCYSLAGMRKEAQAEAKQVLKINPHFSLEKYVRTTPDKNQEAKNRLIEALRNAGLK